MSGVWCLYVLRVACCLLLVVGGWLFGVCWLMFVVCC